MSATPKHYVVRKPIILHSPNLYIEIGDMLIHDSRKMLIVYRAEKIMKTIAQSAFGLTGMASTGIIDPI